MEKGAGSVDVSARPAFPSTLATSGKRLMIRSVTWRSFCASVTGDARHRRGHVEERTFIQGRHELGAELLEYRHCYQHQKGGAADDHPLPAQRPSHGQARKLQTTYFPYI